MYFCIPHSYRVDNHFSFLCFLFTVPLLCMVGSEEISLIFLQETGTLEHIFSCSPMPALTWSTTSVHQSTLISNSFSLTFTTAPIFIQKTYLLLCVWHNRK